MGESWWRENVVKPIHNTRIPLPRIFGVHASVYMQFVYPTLVVITGIVLLKVTTEQSHKNIGINGEKLRQRRDLAHPGTRAQNEALDKVLIAASSKES
mmetsp:Transcript_4447/g.5806  ORF Transcript_4447/g.5806 Transcript_4447/m.5806 type:complete len:98 (-) Transcript_4447:227-520(-)